jgi:YVTN family beta-propeller protein
MTIGKLLLVVVAALAFASANAAPPVQATLTLGNNTEGIAIDPALAKAYVTNFNDGTVSVVDITTLTVQATIPVGTNPRRIIADAATHLVYLTNSTTPGAVTVIDGNTNGIVAVIGVGNDPRGITSNFFIGEVYVANNASNTISVISTASNTVIATIPVGKSPSAPTSNDILRKLYVTNSNDDTVSSIDENSHTVLATIAVGNTPITPTIDALHSRVYINNVVDKNVSVIDSTTDTVVTTIPSGQGQSGAGNAFANFVAVSAVYHRAYLPNAIDGTVTIIDTDANAVVATVPVGMTPVDALVDANGGNVYVINQGSNNVSILDARTNAVIDTLPVGTTPWRIVDGDDHLFVLNLNGAARDTLIIAGEENTLAQTAIATEFYEAVFDHYFHTADEVETRLLEDGIFHDDWHRTFHFWRVWTATGPGRLPVCRFFTTAFGAKSSHFYTPYAAECASLQADPAHVWQLESVAVYYMGVPDITGSCAAGTVPLYRVYNQGMGGSPNHRYTSERAVRDAMVALGWTAEGNGPDIVFACIPTLLSG